MLAVLFSGCTEDFIPAVDSKPVLCINSLITAGEPIEVSVTHTWLYTDKAGESDHNVDDAIVSIYSNGVRVDENYLPKEGDTIKILAESRKYGHAEAEVTVPVSVPVESLDWKTNVKYKWTYDQPGTINIMIHFDLFAKMTLRDPHDTENYYHFSFRSFPERRKPEPDVSWVGEVDFYPGMFHDELEPIFSEHLGLIDAVSGADSYGFTFFTDRQISGKPYALNLQFTDMKFDLRNADYSEDLLDCGLVLTLHTISPDYYSWWRYRWIGEHGSLADLGDIGLSDPLCGYSNVSTGAGVVAAQSTSTCVINLKDFLLHELTP